jgi:hypothetical protein
MIKGSQLSVGWLHDSGYNNIWLRAVVCNALFWGIRMTMGVRRIAKNMTAVSSME